jgi:very-short-patch-repair endonuclease
LSVSDASLGVVSPDDRAAAWLFATQRGVLSRAQVFGLGLTAHGLQHRLRPGGPWQRLLPGVYLTATGQPTREQRLIAAMLYAGPDSVITGPAALRNHGIRGPETEIVDMLVPAGRQRASRGFVAIHRTWRIPRKWAADGPLRFAVPARAVADAVRDLDSLADARATVGSAVQKSRCTIEQLTDELTSGPIRGSARLRAVLAEVADGVRSAAEGDFRALVRRSALPLPMFNARLLVDGVLLAVVDAWWPEASVAVEIDSREWHLLPAHWEDTMRRHDRLIAAGISVIHVSPRQIRTEPDVIVGYIADALQHGRPAAGIVTLPAAA